MSDDCEPVDSRSTWGTSSGGPHTSCSTGVRARAECQYARSTAYERQRGNGQFGRRVLIVEIVGAPQVAQPRASLRLAGPWRLEDTYEG